MKKPISSFLLFSFFFFLSSFSSFAAAGDLAINEANIKFSVAQPLEGQNNRIYATVSNNSNQDLLGVVRLLIDGKQHGADMPVSVFAGANDGVFINWQGAPGNHVVDVVVIPWEPDIDDPSNNKISTKIYVTPDLDRDGTPDNNDSDIDGDGVENEKDAFPRDPKETVDTDGDGKGDTKDEDDDNDGVPDTFDEKPLDPNETLDTDKDGEGNIADKDDDGDELADTEEEKIGTDPMNPDTDKDGTKDGQDAFPSDPAEQLDTDKDGIGNNIDLDDDNDSLPDLDDEFPLNKTPIIKIKDQSFTIGLLEEHIFDATPSLDQDGKIVRYLWEIDGEEREGNAINHRFSRSGTHNVKLTIQDDAGQSAHTEFQVSVLNLRFYKQIILVLLVIALASIFYFKYIAEAKKSKK